MGITTGGILINSLLILQKDISKLQKLSIIGVFAVVVNVLIILFTLITGFTLSVDGGEGGSAKEYVYHGLSNIAWGKMEWMGGSGWEAFSQQVQGLAALIFCFVNHQLMFPLIFDLRDPSKRRLDKVFRRVHLIETAGYFLVGMAGYLLMLEHLEHIPINAMIIASIQTLPVSLGKVLITLSLFLAVPLNLFPTREVLFESLAFEKSNRNHVIVSLGLGFSGAVIAILFQKVNSYFGLLGGTAGVMMAGAIPMVCYYRLIGLTSWQEKAMAVFMAAVCLLSMLGAFLSVIAPS
jgi:amino acid permease